MTSEKTGRATAVSLAKQTSTALVSFSWLFAGSAVAQSDSSSGPGCGTVPSQFQNIVDLLNKIQELGVALALLIAVIMLIYAGLLWMRGTPKHQETAREIIVNVIIGLLIVLTASGIIQWIENIVCGGA